MGFPKGTKFTEQHKNNIRKAMMGKRNAFKNGKKRSSGRCCIYCPQHPFADKRGYIYEHRLVMEKYLGRYLKPEETIHHINENKLDNRLENLMLFPSKSAHCKFHWKCIKKMYKEYFNN